MKVLDEAVDLELKELGEPAEIVMRRSLLRSLKR